MTVQNTIGWSLVEGPTQLVVPLAKCIKLDSSNHMMFPNSGETFNGILQLVEWCTSLKLLVLNWSLVSQAYSLFEPSRHKNNTLLPFVPKNTIGNGFWPTTNRKPDVAASSMVDVSMWEMNVDVWYVIYKLLSSSGFRTINMFSTLWVLVLIIRLGNVVLKNLLIEKYHDSYI